MWHEARKQERLIRGMIVDYRRRAERRKDFYEKIKAEPTQFLQFHGRECKIHLDPAVAAAGEGPAIMMPWQGDKKNMIDRFDVRAHLDYIHEVKTPDIPPEELSQEERQCNYERYRILAQNAFLGISEDKFLKQLAIEEQFGVTVEEKETHKERLSEKKGTGAAIGYNYNDPGAQPSSYNGPEVKKKEVEAKDSDDDSDFDIIDVDLSIDVNKMEALQAHELNAVGPQFGMAGCDLFSFLTGDADDAEHQKQLLREEKEKAMFSGRKSRRERRAHRDRKLATRVVSPPSYAAPSSFAPASRSASRSPSRSPSPEHTSIEFITSFGPEEEEKQPPVPKPLYADKLKQNLKKPDMLYSEAVRKPRPRSKSIDLTRPQIGPRGPDSISRSRSPSRSRSLSKSRSYSRSRSRSRSKSSRSRSKSFAPYRRTRSRSRSRSRPRNYRRRSRSFSNHASAYTNRNRSRSISYESNEKSTVQKKTVPRYYGRRKEDKSSSELSLDSDSSASPDDEKNKSAVGNKSNTNQNQLRLSGSSAKGPSRETLSMKEKLKRKMQAQLSKQLRADKRAEAERLERESRKQARRDEEMRELAIKLRRKQREMRHQRYRHSSDDDSDRSRSGSSSRLSAISENKRDSRSRSKSVPQEKPTSDWDAYKEPPPPYKSKPETGEYAYLSKKRIPDTSEGYFKFDEQREHSSQNRYDKYSNREPGRYNDNFKYERSTRFDQDRQQIPNIKRQFSQRGGYRTQHVKNSEQMYADNTTSRYRDSEQTYGDGPPSRYRESKNYGDGPSGRYRDSGPNYGDGPSGRFRDSGLNYGDDSSGRYRDSGTNYGDGPPGRYRDSGLNYGDGPSGRYRHSGQSYGDGPSSRYRDDHDRESNNYKGKVKLVDY